MPFTGQLRRNEIANSLFNMIISQLVFADNIDGLDDSLVNKCRVDGSLYGDTKLYYATDVGQSKEWVQDQDTNVLEIHRPKEPKTQAITISTFRQIAVTVDKFMSKRAWGTAGVFNDYIGVTLQWVRDTKKVYDYTTFNAFIGTNESVETEQNKVIELPSTADPEAQARLRGQTIAKEIANLFIELNDVSIDYNDYHFLRAYATNKIRIVWNAQLLNEINLIDLPAIFHNQGLKDVFMGETLPSKYFGKVNAEGGTTLNPNKTVRALVEGDYGGVHLFPGQLLPAEATYEANETYTEDNTILCKIMHEDSTPFMSAFETGTEFWNSRNLSTNHYLTWGHNELAHLKQYPYITIKTFEQLAAAASPAKGK